MENEKRLIDANKLIQLAQNHVNGTVDCNDIARFPTIDAVEVVHAAWTENGVCTNCGYRALIACVGFNCTGGTRVTYERTPLCAGCGAKMDGMAHQLGSSEGPWIPAKEPPIEDGEYIVMIHKAANPTTLQYSAEEKSWFEVTVVETTNPDGEEVYTYYPVDWWMPMPVPPAGAVDPTGGIKQPHIPTDSGAIDIERIEVT